VVHLRLTLVRCACLVLAPLLLSACSSEGEPRPNRFECRSRVVDLAFWPEGHPAIESINAPAVSTPHVEVSVGRGEVFDLIDEVFYLDATGESRRGNAACDESTAAAPTGSPPGAEEEVTTTRLTCTFSDDAIIWRTGPGAASAELTVEAAGDVAVRIRLGMSGSTMEYNDELCDLAPSPS